MDQQWFVQGIGIVGMLVAALSFQCKNARQLFLFQMVSSALFVLHFFLLGAYTGALLNLAGMLRSGVLFLDGRRWARSTAAMVLVTLMMAACGAAAWSGWLSLLPTAAMVIGTPFLWTRNGKTLRLATLFCISPCWLVYNALCGSIAGVLTECMNLASILVSICRFGLRNLDSAGR